MDLVTPRAALRLAASLAARPGTVLARGASLLAELGQVGLGTSTLAPHHGDERFAGTDWLTDPLRRRVMQTYLATTGALTGTLDDVTTGLPAEDEARLREIVAALADRACPGDPVPDVVPGPSAPLPGRDVAATPGAVVLRTPMFELLQYLPRTERVHDVPVLLVPPLVHRYYLADLVPGRSLVEHLVDAGLQVLALSFTDPGPDAAGNDLDTYTAAVLDAVEACTRITRCPRVTLAGLRTGGVLAAAVQAHLTGTGRADRVAGAVYLGTVLDQRAALPGFRLDTTVARAQDGGVLAGVLDGRAAARSWTWRRGGEQLRPYAVGSAAADALPAGPVQRALRRWSDDLLHLPAALHADLVALAAADPERPRATVLGTPVEPHRLSCDGYLVTAADDPVQPWTAAHHTAQLLGGACRLVRAPGDQIGALLATGHPDGFRAGPVSPGETPQEWADASTTTPGSWWPDLAAWLVERSGTCRDAPPELGGRRMHPLYPAPGTFLET